MTLKTALLWLGLTLTFFMASTQAIAAESSRVPLASLAQRKQAALSRAGQRPPAPTPSAPSQWIDEGDSYASAQGRRALHRLSGSIVVRAENPAEEDAILGKLTADGAPLARYELVTRLAPGHLHLADSTRRRGNPGPVASRGWEHLETVRRMPGIRSANPVFVSPKTGLRLVTQQTLTIRLEPEVDARAYFGEEWPRVRRLGGTTDQFLLELESGNAEDLFAEVDKRLMDPRVVWAEPDFLCEARRNVADPLYYTQWHLHNAGQNGVLTGADIKAEETWPYSLGNREIVVAVVDDGIEIGHAEMQGKIFTNTGEIPGNGVDDDRNGYVDDLHGWDFFGNNSNANPKHPGDYHGTPMAGIIAAASDNGQGIASLAQRCQVMSVRVFNGPDFVSDSQFAEAVYYAGGRTRDGLGTWRGADIVSMSLTIEEAQVVNDALTWTGTQGRAGRGCPMFGSSGNSASRWNASRVQIPLGAIFGSGAYRIGFEFRKDFDISSGEDLIRIDDVVLLNGDRFTHVTSSLGPQGRQNFEGSFPPTGWNLSSLTGDDWFASTTGALLGSGGTRSARSGFIIDYSWTELQTPLLILQGDESLAFSLYTSCELGYDGLLLWIYNQFDEVVDYFGGPNFEPYLSGNFDVTPATGYPAYHTHVMGVGSSTDVDKRADYSQYGAGLDFLASSAGGWNDIVTIDRSGNPGNTTGDYVPDFGGTSSACALAASIGAMVLSVNPALSANDVRQILAETCDRIGGVSYTMQGWNTHYGHGRLNASRAVLRALEPEYLMIVTATKVDLDMRIEFTTRLGLRYRVEYSDDLPLEPAAWSGVPGATDVAGTGNTVQVVDLLGAFMPQRFYRIQQLP